MDFASVLAALQTGMRAKRAAWSVPGQCVLLKPDVLKSGMSAFVLPENDGREWLDYGVYILVQIAIGKYMPWVAARADVEASDWQLLE